MSKVLVVKAHPLTAEHSRTITVLNQFMQVYQANHPADEISWLDLYQADIPEIDQDLLCAWTALKAGQPVTELRITQQVKLEQFNHYTDQYIATEKFVIANPLWNLNVPTKLKAWLDTVMVAGKTFKYTETAAEPLVIGKRAVHIQSAGGVYAGTDFASQYVKAILGFAGVDEVLPVSIEGADHSPEEAPAIMKAAMASASQLARHF
ncbi:NAD(P)H-dependent oxidoreductase [Latilactobacillus graminis]|uniref:FMN dependent NADH:quinone oxidoreductase n=2 Tax=Latilactobacillus graminis TaxID=60519 RepID=A0AA89I2A1_9LACO|nr:NAD(P)H-dependent oxidoreductase [Latilactobacillus graminis]KRM24184.1 FMN-dependent NADH-azoreductase [Latilactobacillus graminis DSM 20719]QFP78832.1 FMN-dependent NADH-azoreductase [Latilactobacillus graminis]